MTTKVAILHGGPADRMQIVVDGFRPTIFYAINEAVGIDPKHRSGVCDYVEVHKAVYEQVMSPFNSGRVRFHHLATRYIPDQEVALYVYVGEER